MNGSGWTAPPRLRLLKAPLRRIRFLRREEADRLIAALPEHLAVMAGYLAPFAEKLCKPLTVVSQPLGTI